MRAILPTMSATGLGILPRRNRPVRRSDRANGGANDKHYLVFAPCDYGRSVSPVRPLPATSDAESRLGPPILRPEVYPIGALDQLITPKRLRLVMTGRMEQL